MIWLAEWRLHKSANCASCMFSVEMYCITELLKTASNEDTCLWEEVLERVGNDPSTSTRVIVNAMGSNQSSMLASLAKTKPSCIQPPESTGTGAQRLRTSCSICPVVFATEHRESCLSCTSLVYWWDLLHSIRTYSRDSLGFSVAPIPSAHVTKYRVVPQLLTRRFCIQTVL